MYYLLAMALLIGHLAVRDAATQTGYDQYPVYTGRDLGLQYSPAATAVRIWSPTAQQAQLLLYTDDRSAAGDYRGVDDLPAGPPGDRFRTGDGRAATAGLTWA